MPTLSFAPPPAFAAELLLPELPRGLSWLSLIFLEAIELASYAPSSGLLVALSRREDAGFASKFDMF